MIDHFPGILLRGWTSISQRRPHALWAKEPGPLIRSMRLHKEICAAAGGEAARVFRLDGGKAKADPWILVGGVPTAFPIATVTAQRHPASDAAREAFETEGFKEALSILWGLDGGTVALFVEDALYVGDADTQKLAAPELVEGGIAFAAAWSRFVRLFAEEPTSHERLDAEGPLRRAFPRFFAAADKEDSNG